MKIIKNIKVNNKDGSSEVLPVGADAVNIDLKNGKTVEGAIEDISNKDISVDKEILDIKEVNTRQDNDIARMNDKVNSAASGSPAGVYPSLSELIKANPDHSRIYITSDNGNWNYWNGSTFVSGGLYQASLDNESVKKQRDKTDLIYYNYPYVYVTVSKGEPTLNEVGINNSIFRYSTNKIKLDYKSNNIIKMIFKNVTNKTMSLSPYYFNDNNICVEIGSYHEIQPGEKFEESYYIANSKYSYVVFSGKTKDVINLTDLYQKIQDSFKIISLKDEDKLLNNDKKEKFDTLLDKINNDESRLNILESTTNEIDKKQIEIKSNLIKLDKSTSDKIKIIYKENPYQDVTVSKGEPTLNEVGINNSIFRYSTNKIPIELGKHNARLTFKNSTDKTLTMYAYYFDKTDKCLAYGIYNEIKPNETFEDLYVAIKKEYVYVRFSGRTTDAANLTNYYNVIEKGISITDTFIENKILNNDKEEHFDSLLDKINNDESRLNCIENNQIMIPKYFENNINQAIKKINKNMNLVGQHGDTFTFITDIHMEHNAMNSPSLIKKIVNKTNVPNIVCGGDLINYGNTIEEAEEKIKTVMDNYKFLNDKFICIFGNHDGNNEKRPLLIPINSVYNLIFKHQESQVTAWGTDLVEENNPYSQFHWYNDNPATMTRRIYLSSSTGSIGARQLNWLKSILEKNDGYNVIIFVHWIYNGKGIYTGNGEQLKNLCDLHTDKVKCIIAGHVHYDKTDYTTKGIPIIFTTCDMPFESENDEGTTNSGKIGTITELAFDTISVDYNTGTVYCVRVGRGQDRTIPSRVS